MHRLDRLEGKHVTYRTEQGAPKKDSDVSPADS